MDKSLQKICALSGLFGVLLFFAGIMLAGVFPPPSPQLSPEQVVDLYQGNTQQLRFGFLLVMVSGMFVLPLVAVISVQIRRIEGQALPLLAYLQLAAGTVGGTVFYFAAVTLSGGGLSTGTQPGTYLPDE